MKKNKFLALTMLCSTLCGIPTKAQEIKDSGIQKVSGETDSSKKDKTPSLKKNDKQISQINTKKVLGLWAIHETLSYFGGNFGQFYHKPARLSVVGASRWIGECRNNKNLKKKYKQLIDCLKDNVKVRAGKHKYKDVEKVLVTYENNLSLPLSYDPSNKGEFSLTSYKYQVKAVKSILDGNNLQLGNFLEDFDFLYKYTDTEVFIGLVNVSYKASQEEKENFKDFLISSYTCEQLNEWSRSDYSPIVALHYTKYNSINNIWDT